MKFLVDAQLPLALAIALRQSGYEAIHVFEISLAQAADGEIWSYACENKLVILSKDEDFADRIDRGRQGTSVVWIRVGNCSNRELLGMVLPMMPQVIVRLDLNETLIEIR